MADSPKDGQPVVVPVAGADVQADILCDWLTSRKKRHLIVLIGIPASGKSTLADSLRQRAYKTVCLDEIRRELFGDAALQDGLDRVLAAYYRRLYWLMRKGKPVTIDATSTKFEDRMSVIRLARKHHYKVTLVLVDTPLSVALERNRRRERVVPDEAVRRMHAELRGRGYPRRHEGRLVVLKPATGAGCYYLSRIREGLS